MLFRLKLDEMLKDIGIPSRCVDLDILIATGSVMPANTHTPWQIIMINRMITQRIPNLWTVSNGVKYPTHCPTLMFYSNAHNCMVCVDDMDLPDHWFESSNTWTDVEESVEEDKGDTFW